MSPGHITDKMSTKETRKATKKNISNLGDRVIHVTSDLSAESPTPGKHGEKANNRMIR